MAEELFNKRFKQFGGGHIPNLIEYLKEYLTNDPTVTIAIGCDSKQNGPRTMYAITIMLYNNSIKNGAHVIFYRESFPKIRDIYTRLHKEADILYELGLWLDSELKQFYKRQDLDDAEIRRYKWYNLRNEGLYGHINPIDQQNFINKLTITEGDRIAKRNIDIHLDYNPIEDVKNKSNPLYKALVPWLIGEGFRTFCKSYSPAASAAADLLLKS